MLKAANRLSSIEPFRVMALLARANELAEAGHDVIHLEVGEPDFETPRPIVTAGQRALESGYTRYTDARGIPALREKISAHYATRHNLQIASDRIFVTAGASGGLLLLTSLLVNAGNNLLMTDPGYPCNRHFLTAIGAEGKLVPVSEETGYQLTPDLVNSYWDDQTAGILLASPANPTGAVLSSEELISLTEAVNEHNGLTIVDEIYHGLTYDNESAASVLSIDDNAFVVNSFSKYFGMTGWRLGWVVVPASLSTDLEKLAQNLFICPATLSQHAALAAFDSDSIEIMESQRLEFEARRNYLLPALRNLGFKIPHSPAGAFYIYAGLPDGFDDSELFCHNLLENYHVAVTPGTDFGMSKADSSVRFSYAVSLEKLQEAVRRIEQMLS